MKTFQQFLEASDFFDEPAPAPAIYNVMSFKLFLENAKIPSLLQGLAAEARKCNTFEEFEKDYSHQLKHGLYFHWTDDPNFQIDPAKGPRDMSSMSNGGMVAGKLMITTDLHHWSLYGNNRKGRKYVAIIDMSNVPRNAYQQVSRGFGNEFFVSDPSQAKVTKVVFRARAFQIDREHHKMLPNSREALFDFYKKATGKLS